MISVVIRNKNESRALNDTLRVLRSLYDKDLEIIIVDNESTDESRVIAENYNCKIVSIKEFTYGKAINLGIQNAKNDFVLLLSAHAIPVGKSFFENSIKVFKENPNTAGLRYINSHQNYMRAVENDFKVSNALSYGLMAACAMINKNVWREFKFDEDLVFSEDKEWSNRVINNGYEIRDIAESFFYFLKRDKLKSLKRWENETIAEYQLFNKQYPGYFKIIMRFFYKVFILNLKNNIENIVYETKLLKIKLSLKKIIENKKKNVLKQ